MASASFGNLPQPPGPVSGSAEDLANDVDPEEDPEAENEEDDDEEEEDYRRDDMGGATFAGVYGEEIYYQDPGTGSDFADFDFAHFDSANPIEAPASAGFDIDSFFPRLSSDQTASALFEGSPQGENDLVNHLSVGGSSSPNDDLFASFESSPLFEESEVPRTENVAVESTGN